MRRLVLAVVVAAAISACGSDGEVGEVPTNVTTDDADTADASSVDAMGAADICERLTVASVAADTGLDISRAVPDDAATPQCAYEYVTDTGGVSTLSVASMRSQDVGGLSGSDAFDVVVDINETAAGDGAESQGLSAGDAAVRITGTSLHLGVLQLSDRVFTLIIPVDDVGPDGVDSLIATMATTLG